MIWAGPSQPNPVTGPSHWHGWATRTRELIYECTVQCEGNYITFIQYAKTWNCESGAKERRTYLEMKSNALVCRLIGCFTLYVLFSSSSSCVLSFFCPCPLIRKFSLLVFFFLFCPLDKLQLYPCMLAHCTKKSFFLMFQFSS